MIDDTAEKRLAENKAAAHRWTFFRAAGVVQPRIKDAEDIRHLDELPDELWTILSCPSKGLEFDQKTFDAIDADKDGHARTREIQLAVAWMLKRMNDPAALFKDSDVVDLSEFADTDEGKSLAEAAKMMLGVLGKADAQSFSLADVLAREASYLNSPFNGDGVIVDGSVEDAKLKTLFGEVVKVTGGTPDRGGAPGVDKAKLEAFYADAAAHLAWIEKGQKEAETLLPLGDKTAAAAAAIDAVRAKVDDFFLRGRVASFDAKAIAPMNRGEADYAAVSQGDIVAQTAAIAEFPIAQVEPGRALPLCKGVNPAWAAAVATLKSAAVDPLLGGDAQELTEDDWKAVCAKIAPYQAWQKGAAAPNAAALGEARLREVLADTASKEALAKLIDKDAANAAEVGKLAELEQFVRYHAHLNRLFNNFVNFSDYYDPKYLESFRAGRLYIDGRVCHLCMYVDDPGAHSTLAASSKMFLAYCEITRSHTGEKRTICVAVTAGFASSIWVGRHGIFYDRRNNDWEAVIVKIVESQISLKEAFWSPWIKISQMVSDQVKKLLSSRESAMLTAASTKVDAAGAAVETAAPPPAPAAKPDGAAVASSIAAVGIGVGFLGTAVGSIISAVAGIPVWKTLLGVLCILLIVSMPSVILAWFKLRARDLGPLLNACGWAVNRKLKMTLKLGREFTHEAVVPFGSKIEVGDIYAERNPWRTAILAAILAIVVALCLNHWFGWFYCPFCFQRHCDKPANAKVEPAPDCAHEPLPAEAAPAETPAAPAEAPAPASPAETPAPEE